MNEDKVITGEDFSPTGLTTIEYFDYHEDFEVFMIYENLDRISGIFEIMISVFHRIDNGKYFSIMDIVVIFSWNALSRSEDNRI